jgi:hypothetical protein
MQRPHDELPLSPAEGDALIERLEHHALSVEDRCVLVQVVRWLFWLVFVVQEATLSLKRLRTVLFGHGAKAATSRTSEASSPSSALADEGAGSGERRARGAEVPREASDPAALSKPLGGHRPGTGRLSADASVGAERIACRHAELAVGQRCPVCGQGTFYELPPGREMRIDGHALLSALRYALQTLRCSACGQICTATLPDKAGEEKYSARARAVLAIGRYSLGLPL